MLGTIGRTAPSALAGKRGINETLNRTIGRTWFTRVWPVQLGSAQPINNAKNAIMKTTSPFLQTIVETCLECYSWHTFSEGVIKWQT
jgi:hypothetical protein